MFSAFAALFYLLWNFIEFNVARVLLHIWFLKSININKLLLLRHVDIEDVRIIVVVCVVEYIVRINTLITFTIYLRILTP